MTYKTEHEMKKYIAQRLKEILPPIGDSFWESDKENIKELIKDIFLNELKYTDKLYEPRVSSITVNHDTGDVHCTFRIPTWLIP